MSFTIFDALDEIGCSTHRTDYPHQLPCPFHASGKEVNPSARVYPETDSIYCFTCGKSWNPIAVIAQGKGISYTNAARSLVQQYGIRLGNSRQSAKLDEWMAEIIAASRMLPSEKKQPAHDDINDLLFQAATGEPVWDVVEGIKAWAKKYYPRLTL